MEIKEDKPENRIDHMTYLPDMEVLESDVQRKVIERMEQYDYDKYTAKDVKAALSHEVCTVENFEAFLSTGCTSLSGRNGTKSTKGNEKTFWKFYLYVYTFIYCELL